MLIRVPRMRATSALLSMLLTVVLPAGAADEATFAAARQALMREIESDVRDDGRVPEPTRTRRSRHGGHGVGAATRVRATRRPRSRLREPAAADRVWADDLAAVHRGGHDRPARTRAGLPRARSGHRLRLPGRRAEPVCARRSTRWRSSKPLGRQARQRLARLGYSNVDVRIGDGYYGWPEAAPFDVIVVTAVAGHIPPPLLKQLKPGGRMVLPVGTRFTTQQLVLVQQARPTGASRRGRCCPSPSCRSPADMTDAAQQRPPLASVALLSSAVLATEILLSRAVRRGSLAPLRVHDHQPRAARLRRERRVPRARASPAAAAVRGELPRQRRWHSPRCVHRSVRCWPSAMPFQAEALLWDPWQPLWLVLVLPRAVAPFFCAANAIGLALIAFRDRAGRVYAADLIGAGLGSVLVLALLYWLWPEEVLRVIAAAGLLATCVGALELRVRVRSRGSACRVLAPRRGTRVPRRLCSGSSPGPTRG